MNISYNFETFNTFIIIPPRICYKVVLPTGIMLLTSRALAVGTGVNDQVLAQEKQLSKRPENKLLGTNINIKWISNYGMTSQSRRENLELDNGYYKW